MGDQFPRQCPRPVVALFEAAIGTQFEHQQMRRAAGKRHGFALCGFDLDTSGARMPVIPFGRRGAQFNAVVMARNSFTQTADEMPVRGEVPTRKHRFELSDDVVKLANQSGELDFVHSWYVSSNRRTRMWVALSLASPVSSCLCWATCTGQFIRTVRSPNASGQTQRVSSQASQTEDSAYAANRA